jgi:hypothetical protein
MLGLGTDLNMNNDQFDTQGFLDHLLGFGTLAATFLH